jgi:uncharacterized protein DUF6531
MRTRFAIGILAALFFMVSITPADAQQQSASRTFHCGTGYTWTEQLTLDRGFARLGDTVHGSFSSGYSFSACGATGTSIPIFAYSYFGGQEISANWVVTDSAGTHYDYVTWFTNINGTDGNYSATFTFTPVTSQNPNNFTADIFSGVPLFVTFGPPDNSPDLGSSAPRSGCEGICGSPINLASGNTWIQRQDYSLPGLGGGLQLTLTWNSMWPDNFPFQEVGMFGDSWQSNYEEHIQTTPTGANYWRADGSAWEFTYNSQSKAYTLISPLDERASLSFSSRTTLFTLTSSTAPSGVSITRAISPPLSIGTPIRSR